MKYLPADSTVERFLSKACISDEPSACWVWQKGLSRKGYGSFSANGKSVQAHRYSYEIAFGAIPDNLCVCHRCDNRRCVNPHHLWLGTNADNTRDKMQKGRHVVAFGVKQANAKLTDAKVIEIFHLRQRGLSQEKIAKQFGLDQTAISLVLRRKTWKHVHLICS